jgi:hypothetical protein
MLNMMTHGRRFTTNPAMIRLDGFSGIGNGATEMPWRWNI